MAASRFIVRPIDRKAARRMCEDHPHARTLPNSSKHYMRLDIGGRPAGLAVWGYGIVPQQTPRHLFGDEGNLRDYLELCRFFVYDWCPRNTPSKFLAIAHRLIRRHATNVKWLYTYAAGFQGLIGHIYKGAGYTYIGRTLCNSMLYIPGRGLVHRIALHHRYGRGTTEARHWQSIFPGSKQWCGYNFRYLFWLCGKVEKRRLMDAAKFDVLPYPTEDDLEIWLVDEHRKREAITPAFAKTIPIIKLPTRRKRAGSGPATRPSNQAGEGGATPTPALSTSDAGLEPRGG